MQVVRSCTFTTVGELQPELFKIYPKNEGRVSTNGGEHNKINKMNKQDDKWTTVKRQNWHHSIDIFRQKPLKLFGESPILK